MAVHNATGPTGGKAFLPSAPFEEPCGITAVVTGSAHHTAFTGPRLGYTSALNQASQPRRGGPRQARNPSYLQI